jgi:excisionase family DNA binding protein
MTTTTAQPLLSVREAAELLRVSRRTVYTLVERDGLPAVRIGGLIRFVPSAVEEWLDAQRAGNTAP